MEEKGKDLLNTQGCSASYPKRQYDRLLYNHERHKEQGTIVHCFSELQAYQLGNRALSLCWSANVRMLGCMGCMKHYRSAGCQKVFEGRTWELWNSESDSEEKNGRCVL